jgi:hypothetical protein
MRLMLNMKRRKLEINILKRDDLKTAKQIGKQIEENIQLQNNTQPQNYPLNTLNNYVCVTWGVNIIP